MFPKAWLKVLTPVSGFKKCGVYPLNRSVIPVIEDAEHSTSTEPKAADAGDVFGIEDDSETLYPPDTDSSDVSFDHNEQPHTD